LKRQDAAELADRQSAAAMEAGRLDDGSDLIAIRDLRHGVEAYWEQLRLGVILLLQLKAKPYRVGLNTPRPDVPMLAQRILDFVEGKMRYCRYHIYDRAMGVVFNVVFCHVRSRCDVQNS
jgi:hypothetical protein